MNEIKIHSHRHIFMAYLDFTELSPLQKIKILIGDTCSYFNQDGRSDR
jgi:hypothetical protein